MSYYVLFRHCSHRLENGVRDILKKSVIRCESHASFPRKLLTVVNSHDNVRTVLPNVPCLCLNQNHVLRHWNQSERHINTPSFQQKQTSEKVTILDQHFTVLLNSVTVRCLQTAETADKRLSLDDTDFRNFVLDILRQYNEAQEKVTRSKITEKDRKAASLIISDLALAAAKIQEWVKIRQDIQTVQQLFEDDQEKEMQELAEQELDEFKERLEAVEDEVMQLVSPRDANDDNDVIIEFTAGVGGQEAMLFTADVFNMYQRFACHMKWRFQVLGLDTTDLGGVRHASVSVVGHQAYKRFKLEAGVHRVQRIPKTEKSGRVHTSTMTVAVLPQPKKIDIKLENKDLKIETKKASGAGGQHVNTTDSAVRIVHLPTGMVAECQQERSQLKNKQIAMQLLQAKIYSQRLNQQTRAEQTLRKQQVGSSGRSEKIRTYNFAQDRITDHRLGASVHGMDAFLYGGEMLEEITDRLMEQSMKETLKYEVEEFIRLQKCEQS